MRPTSRLESLFSCDQVKICDSFHVILFKLHNKSGLLKPGNPNMLAVHSHVPFAF